MWGGLKFKLELKDLFMLMADSLREGVKNPSHKKSLIWYPPTEVFSIWVASATTIPRCFSPKNGFQRICLTDLSVTGVFDAFPLSGKACVQFKIC